MSAVEDNGLVMGQGPFTMKYYISGALAGRAAASPLEK